jgi:cell division protein ZapD
MIFSSKDFFSLSLKIVSHFLAGTSIWDKRTTVSTLVDILQIFTRHDLKAETLKELERHSNRLNQLSAHEGVDTKRLRQIISELNSTSKILYATNGKIDLSSMESDLFKTITQRSSIPGGTCSFDLPSYHFLPRNGRVVKTVVLGE